MQPTPMHTTATGMDLPAAYVMVDSLAQRRNTNVCLRQCWRRANGFYVAQKEKSGNSMQKTKSPQDAGLCSANKGGSAVRKEGLEENTDTPPRSAAQPEAGSLLSSRRRRCRASTESRWPLEPFRKKVTCMYAFQESEP
jgi:hypothetical protein